jgi:AraC family transcriptional regulator
MAESSQARFRNRAQVQLQATQKCASPVVVAYDVACTSGQHDHADEEVAPLLQLVIPRRGVFRWHLGERTMLAEPNTVLLFHPSRAHRITHPADGGDDCTSLHLSPEYADEALGASAATSSYWLLDGASQRRVHLAAHIVRSNPDTLACEEATMAILRILARTPEHQCARHAREVDAIRERLAADPGERATLPNLAHDLGLSPFELARRFRAHTGSSIHQYRLRMRLSLALSKLHDGAGDVAALALDLGFASHAHFTTAFRNAFGVTPTRAKGLKSQRS